MGFFSSTNFRFIFGVAFLSSFLLSCESTRTVKSETKRFGGGSEAMEHKLAPDPNKRSQYDSKIFKTETDNNFKKPYTTGEYATSRWEGNKNYSETKAWNGTKNALNFDKSSNLANKQANLGTEKRSELSDKNFSTSQYSGKKDWYNPKSPYQTSSNRFTEKKREEYVQPSIMDSKEYAEKTIEETRGLLGRD